MLGLLVVFSSLAFENRLKLTNGNAEHVAAEQQCHLKVNHIRRSHARLIVPAAYRQSAVIAFIIYQSSLAVSGSVTSLHRPPRVVVIYIQQDHCTDATSPSDN